MCDLLIIIEGVLIILLGGLVWRLEANVRELVEIVGKIAPRDGGGDTEEGN